MQAQPTAELIGPSADGSPDTATLTRRRGFGWLAGVGVVGPIGVAATAVCVLAGAGGDLRAAAGPA